MATPTKADALHERMEHAFGAKQVERNFDHMVAAFSRNLLDFLTDDARDELLRRCIVSHKLHRRFAAENRKHHQRRAS